LPDDEVLELEVEVVEVEAEDGDMLPMYHGDKMPGLAVEVVVAREVQVEAGDMSPV
jgi:hypothetical protein